MRTANLLGATLTGADIRTTQILDPNADPYIDEVISFLAKRQPAAQLSAKIERETNRL